MIEDLDGATLEPSRRRHVAVLSAATAAVSVVLLVALVVPPSSLDATVLTASPAPSASAGAVVTIVSGPTMFFQLGTSLRVYLPRISECVDEAQADSPYVSEGNGQVIAAYSSGRTGRSVPTAPDVYVGTGWLTVSCATSNVSVPRSDRER